jgi:hypothetical protein
MAEAPDILYEIGVDTHIALNGTLFTITSGKYEWTMECPDACGASLMNPTMPSPSFVASEIGDYNITLAIDDRLATIIVRVT